MLISQRKLILGTLLVDAVELMNDLGLSPESIDHILFLSAILPLAVALGLERRPHLIEVGNLVYFAGSSRLRVHPLIFWCSSLALLPLLDGWHSLGLRVPRYFHVSLTLRHL